MKDGPFTESAAPPKPRVTFARCHRAEIRKMSHEIKATKAEPRNIRRDTKDATLRLEAERQKYIRLTFADSQ